MRKFDKVLITGGAGYCGTRLVPQLLDLGYDITVFDTFYYFNPEDFPKHPNLRLVKGDIRDVSLFEKTVQNHEVVVNLACISNDASFELNEDLSTTINLDAFEPMVVASKNAGIKRFIYASSSSVYGVSDKPNVTEDHPLVPLTLYNRYKGECEPKLFAHTDEKFVGVVFRPATVCGYSPCQRLDLSVNILTNLAVNKREITVFGGSQMRPNLHIQDYCDVVKLLLVADDEKIQNEIFNVGNQNLTIGEIALMVKKIVENKFPEKSQISIITTSSDDNRSYHINSDKIKAKLGFEPKYSIENAVLELCDAFESGKLPNSLTDDFYFRVKKLKRLLIK